MSFFSTTLDLSQDLCKTSLVACLSLPETVVRLVPGCTLIPQFVASNLDPARPLRLGKAYHTNDGAHAARATCEDNLFQKQKKRVKTKQGKHTCFLPFLVPVRLFVLPNCAIGIKSISPIASALAIPYIHRPSLEGIIGTIARTPNLKHLIITMWICS